MSFLLFVVMAIVGLSMLGAACVVWLQSLTGSLIVALLLVAVLFVVIAITIYLVAIRSKLRQWQRRLYTVYDMSLTFEMLYREAVTFLKKILGGT